MMQGRAHTLTGPRPARSPTTCRRAAEKRWAYLQASCDEGGLLRMHAPVDPPSRHGQAAAGGAAMAAIGAGMGGMVGGPMAGPLGQGLHHPQRGGGLPGGQGGGPGGGGGHRRSQSGYGAGGGGGAWGTDAGAGPYDARPATAAVGGGRMAGMGGMGGMGVAPLGDADAVYVRMERVVRAIRKDLEFDMEVRARCCWAGWVWG